MSFQLWLADALAEAGWRLLPAMHARVRENVRHVLGVEASKQDVDRMARQSWRNYLRYLREFVSIPNWKRDQIEVVARAIEGWEHVREAMSHGRGAVVVSAHFGNWDMAAAIGARAYRVNVLADTFSSQRLDKLVNSFRTALGIQVIPVERALKRTLTALKRGEAVAFLVDKPVGKNGVVVNFFGHPVQVPGGAGFFAVKAGAPILPAFVWRNRDNSYSGRVLPPIYSEPSGDMERDVRSVMERVMSAIEEMVRARPEHWYMFRRMWREEAAVA
ncbi:MAG: lysophospholipid acyltransferase family protein [Chloroflexota bacterium]|nr:lysophospholipid acyltransferase family protein [Chloroflexota bacterium]